MGAKTQIQLVGLCLPVANCSEVTLCLLDVWASRTVNGTRLAFGKIVAKAATKLPVNGAGCLTLIVTSPCYPCGNVSAPISATKTVDGCAYTIEIDLDQFLDDPDTEEPWEPVATDVCELSPFPCEVQALLAAQLLTQLDCTLEHSEEDGTVGIPATAEPDTGAVEYLGFDGAGCSVRVKTTAAAREMTEASASLAAFAANTPKLLDFDGFLFDTLNPAMDLGGDFIIVPGADCHILFPKAGVYEVFAQIQFTNTDWGHSGTIDRAAIQLLTKLNSDSSEYLNSNAVPGFDTTDERCAPVVSGLRKFVVAAGDELRLYAQHTDTSSSPTAHALIPAGTLARLEVTKIH